MRTVTKVLAGSVPFITMAGGVAAKEPSVREWAEVHLLGRADSCPADALVELAIPQPGAEVRIAARSPESTVMLCENPDGSWVYFGDRDGETILAPAVRVSGDTHLAWWGSTTYQVTCGKVNRLYISTEGIVTDDEGFVGGCHQLLEYASIDAPR